MTPDIHDYNARQSQGDRGICDLLAEEIHRGLPEAEAKVWHAHPVWFLDGNPVVGYSKLKDSVRLLFWSGQSFNEPGLSAEGSFKAAEARYTDPDQIDVEALRRWLAEARSVQWNYRDIRRNRGLVPLLGITEETS